MDADANDVTSLPWPLIAAGAGAAGALLLLLLAARRRRAQRLAEEEGRPAPAERPAPQPEPELIAAAARDQSGPRPWIEIDFQPERAAADEHGASVQFALTVRNAGAAPARNVCIEARMFNAGAGLDQEIGAFFAGAETRRGAFRIPEILPRHGQQVKSRLALPRSELREISVQGRRLFVPMVAFNIMYEWGDGQIGQTSMSYLVGRQAESEKMGAFRLDLGPRIYRSLGQRQHELARVV